jgi:hypothetical protein
MHALLISIWSAPSTFTPMTSADRSCSHVAEVDVQKNPARGGSSDTDTKLPMTIATGSSSTMAVTTVTHVGNCPMTSRKWRGSIAAASLIVPTLIDPACHAGARRDLLGV